MGFWDVAKWVITAGVLAASILLPGSQFFLAAGTWTKLAVSFGLTALNILVGVLLGPKAPDTPNLEVSVTLSAVPAQFVIGRMRVPGTITKVAKTGERHFSRDESLYILYTVANHPCREFHGFWFNSERFIRLNYGANSHSDPIIGRNYSKLSGSVHGPYDMELQKQPGPELGIGPSFPSEKEQRKAQKAADKLYKKRKKDYEGHLEVYFNLTGDNTNNESIPGLNGVVPNSTLPVSWVCLRVRDRKKFWQGSGVGMSPTSATFEITGTETNGATALRNFMVDNMGVSESDFDSESYARAVEICKDNGRFANGVWRHNEKERIYTSLLEVVDGAVIYERGKLHILPDVLQEESFLITQEMLLGQVEHKPKGDLLNYANTVQAEINDANAGWQTSNTGEIRNEPAIEEDGRQFVNDVGTLRLMTDIAQARRYLVKQLGKLAQFSELKILLYPGFYTLSTFDNIVPDIYVFQLEVTNDVTGQKYYKTVRLEARN